MRKQILFSAILTLLFARSIAQPTVAAPTPPVRNAGDVISLFSEAYTNVSGINWFPNWGQTTTVSDVLIAGNPTKKYTNLNYQGVQFSGVVNASSMSNLHIDIWTANTTAFDLFLINTSPSLFEKKVTLNPTFSGWNSYDIPLTQYSGVALNNIAQMKIVGTPSGTTVYMDNMYFWKSSNIPTITGFSIPEKFVGDAPFTITQPTSNSTGAFTYTSSNTSVATISGNVITILAAGTSTITANQAAAAPYAAGSATATLLVSYPPPTTAAPVPPTRSSADYLSLYSNAYTNLGGINWNPSWGQSTVVADIVIAGDTTRRYTNLNYQGVQLASAINVSSMSKLHVDIWTPNCTAFDLYLINTTPTTVEQKYTLTPTLSGWNSYDIPLTAYSLVNLSNISQLKFVGTPSGTSVIYMDNLYFWKASNAPTITGFNIPAKVLGDAPFTITQPTSNSTGAFTYTSSNPAVATISGNVITITGVGTSTITANQAAAGTFTAGSATSVLVVTYPPPATAAPTPPLRNTADYVSLYSDSYTNVAGTDWNPNWGQSTVASEVNIVGNPTRKYENLNYQGIQLAAPINVAAMQKLHIDVYTPNCTAFDVYLINTTPAVVEQKVTLTPTLSGWNSFDIALTQYTTVALNNISQIKFIGTPSGTSVVYYDNLYFWKAGNAPTLSNFSIPTQYTGTAPFSITAPTSNSSGAFTYTSSNPSVATVSGSIITIVGVGTAVITATQAAAGAYGSGSIATNLSVTTAPPPSAAPVPPVRNASDVMNLYSEAYTEIAGTNWNPNWGQTTLVSDLTISGNNTKKYELLNYQGVELSGPINISAMTKMHLDVWTPNCTAFDLYLINISPATVEERVRLTPTLSGWNSFDVDLSQYDTVNRAAIAQIKLVAVPFGSSSLFMDNLYFWKPAGTVPVRLVTFNATKQKNQATLNWSSANEQAFKGYVIQKSADGSDWKDIGFTPANNNVTLKQYAHTDNQPYVGVNFYRLKMVDLDGQFSYSSVRKLLFEKAETLSVSVFPNPATEHIRIVYNDVIPGISHIVLTDATGRVVKSLLESNSQRGKTIDLPVQSIEPGAYYLRIRSNSFEMVEKIMIQ